MDNFAKDPTPTLPYSYKTWQGKVENYPFQDAPLSGIYAYATDEMRCMVRVLEYLGAQINIDPFKQDTVARKIFERAMIAALEDIKKP